MLVLFSTPISPGFLQDVGAHMKMMEMESETAKDFFCGLEEDMGSE